MSLIFHGTNGITFPDSSAQLNAGIGYNQTWQNLTASRASGVTYTNTSGRPIQVSIRAVSTSTVASVSATVDGLNIAASAINVSSFPMTVSFIVPPGVTYSVVVANATLSVWAELR